MNNRTLETIAGALGRVQGLLLAVALVSALSGCNEDGTGLGNVNGTKAVSLSFGLSGGAAAPAPSMFAGSLELMDGTNTLVIESAELVLKEIEFERVESTGCDSLVDDDDCEEFELGPFLVSLDLNGSVSQEITAQVDTGTYDEIEFKIHKTEDSDAAFLAANPGFDGISIKVTGTYNGELFEYTTDVNEEKEIDLTSPLVVTEDSGPVNVTLEIDVSSWFVDGGGMLVDPSTANKGEPNESLVEENIKISIDGFRDDDHDGVPHDEDGDEDDGIGDGS